MRNGFVASCCQLIGITSLFLFLRLGAAGAEKITGADAPPKPEEPTDTQQTLRAYLQLQEQLHDTLLTIDRTRKEADAAARVNAEAVAARLEAIEQTLGTQQIHAAKLLQDSNRVTLIATGVFAGLGMLDMIITALFLLMAMI